MDFVETAKTLTSADLTASHVESLMAVWQDDSVQELLETDGHKLCLPGGVDGTVLPLLYSLSSQDYVIS